MVHGDSGTARLKLEAVKAPAEVLVVDHVERPSAY
jgi:hypothetical protein